MSQSNSYVERIVAEVGTWPNVEVGGHRFGGTAFRLGPREVGHVHDWGSVDVPLPMRVRDLLVEDGIVDPHPVYPLSGWTSRMIRESDDVLEGLRVLRLSYVINCISLQHPIDVDAELTSLGFDEALGEYVTYRARRHGLSIPSPDPTPTKRLGTDRRRGT